MNRIVTKKSISEDLVKLEIRTSIAVNNIQPGQYIILRMEENEPGIPLPVVKTNAEKETITVIVSVTDENNRQLANMNEGNSIFGIEGPFGYPAQIENFGTVLCIGRGPGIIALLPVLNSLRAIGNQIVTVLSAQSKDGIILENEIKAVSDEVITITDDGSYGEKESIYQVVGQVLRNNRINQVFVIGTAKTIKETCSHTTKNNIPTQAVLHLGKTVENGAHGIFRVSICGSGKAVCVDGFNFNAWYPNFEEMIKRFGSSELGIQSTLKVSD
jgi:NAD(P)H-flavin reductase